jgi:DNA invertase Pin-like site-specific DNA recombinase
MKKRVIALLRVSSDQQDLERQRRDVAAAARAHNLEIIRTVELADVSGTKVLTNAEVRKVLADLSRPDVHGVAISAVDRLVRPGELGDLQIFDAFQRTKKKILTPGQEIDLTTTSGFLTSGIMGVIAGFERQMILARTSAGKKISRQRGGNPNGSAVLPRGVAYSKATGWCYVEPDCSRIRQAYDLLFERRSWHDIAERIGGGFTHAGVSNSLKNPIWAGVRRYTKGREEPLELKVIEHPLIEPARWQAAQEIILEKRSRWLKTKKPPRFLLSGLLRCGRCGSSVYLLCQSPSKPRSYYHCSKRCGAPSVQQHSADHTVERFISNELLDTAFLRTVFGRFQSGQPARDANAEQVAHRREKLEAERQRLLRMTLKGISTEEDFARESKRIETEMRELDRLMPAPLPAALDKRCLIMGVSSTLDGFAARPFEQKREVLQTVIRELVLEDGAFTGLTFNGGFLTGVNLEPRSRSPWSPRCRGRA